ncbi:MAG TPA: hypothetical protein VE403_08750 [Sphingomicrobium sp.]|nr:hypothetical protein [Sphingomicrobium sp.]
MAIVIALITIATLWPLAVFKRKIIANSKPKRARKNDLSETEQST